MKKYIQKNYIFLQQKYTLHKKMKMNNIRLNNNLVLFLFLQQFIGTDVYIKQSY